MLIYLNMKKKGKYIILKQNTQKNLQKYLKIFSKFFIYDIISLEQKEQFKLQILVIST